MQGGRQRSRRGPRLMVVIDEEHRFCDDDNDDELPPTRVPSRSQPLVTRLRQRPSPTNKNILWKSKSSSSYQSFCLDPRSLAMSRSLLLLLPLTCASGLSVDRRALLRDAAAVIGGATTTTLVASPPAHAARGAAELDLEFYLRDLVGGNRQEGNILPSQPPPIQPPRVLKDTLRLLDDSSECLAVQALLQTLRADDTNASERIRSSVVRYRDKAKRSFAAKAPWNEESFSDQYYFDLTAYALWRTAADELPNYVARDRFVRQLGRLILQRTQTTGLIRPVSSSSTLTGSLVAMNEVLRVFVESGFCSGYRIGEAVKNEEDALPVFDALDDDALASGATVDCLVSVFEPATLGASLQITGEQSRFGPDFVGPTLAALWETNGISARWETFFVDPEYRPNPKDYFPNEQLLQYTLYKK